jgi:hypothetical protein
MMTLPRDILTAGPLGLLGWMLEGLDAGRRAQALGALRATVAAHTAADGVVYRSGAWLIRAQRA